MRKPPNITEQEWLKFKIRANLREDEEGRIIRDFPFCFGHPDLKGAQCNHTVLVNGKQSPNLCGIRRECALAYAESPGRLGISETRIATVYQGPSDWKKLVKLLQDEEKRISYEPMASGAVRESSLLEKTLETIRLAEAMIHALDKANGFLSLDEISEAIQEEQKISDGADSISVRLLPLLQKEAQGLLGYRVSSKTIDGVTRYRILDLLKSESSKKTERTHAHGHLATL